jgi:hypothetical protein
VVALVEWLKEQAPEIQEMAKTDPKGLKKLLLRERLLRKKYYPCKDFVPNVAQQRAISCFKAPNPITGDYPTYTIFTGGNGVGKTCILAIFLAGVCYGKEYINLKYFDYQFFDDVAAIRRKRPFAVRIVCAKSDMEQNGSIYQQISKWIPRAKFSGKTDNYYTCITIEHPDKSKGYKPIVIDIKTHDMGVIKFSGSDCDLVIFNEPIKDKKKFEECVGRLRMGGWITMFLTPDDGVPYLFKLVKDPRNKNVLYHSQGSIWENCKDIPGTNGVLSKQKIEALIAGWRTDPTTLAAREKGEFIHLAGAVFTLYNDKLHVIPPELNDEGKIYPNWNIVQIVDPHPVKPTLSVWMALSPLNVWYVIAEYPLDPWDELGPSHKTIKMFGFDWMLTESGKVGRFKYMRGAPKVHKDYRIGDPNAFAAKQQHNKQTIQWQYEEDTGFWYNLDVDNSIELRHDKIKNLIAYDNQREIDCMNSPKLYIFDTCENVQNAFVNYCCDANGKPQEDWKDWIDAIGYGVTTIDCWTYQDCSVDDDYEENKCQRRAPIKAHHKTPMGVHMEVLC